MALCTYRVTWRRIDDPESTFDQAVIAADLDEAFLAARAELRLAFSEDVSQWTMAGVERIAPTGRERIL